MESRAQIAPNNAADRFSFGSVSPLKDDFCCRQREFAALSVLLRHAQSVEEVTSTEIDALAATQPPERATPGSLGWRPIVLVQGRSGMGKSRLLKEVAIEAVSLGVRVKELLCYERQGVPFLPILRAVKEVISESTSREPLWRKYARVLARVFPELASELGESLTVSDLSGDDGKLQLFDALAGILIETSRDRPLLLLIHDLHRSDPGTVEFLRYLGRNVFLEESLRRRDARGAADTLPGIAEENWKEIGGRDGRSSRQFITDGLADEDFAAELASPGLRLMVIANYLHMEPIGAESGGTENEENEHERRMVRSIEKLTSEPFAFSMALAPLSEQELESLITNSLPGVQIEAGVVRRLEEMTGGTPLRAVELCRCIAEAGDLSEADAAGGGVPQRAARLALADLDRLFQSYIESTTLPSPGDGSGSERSASPGGSASGDGLLSAYLVRRRLRSLDGIEVRILEVLSVLRRPAQVGLLEDILELPRESIIAAIDGLRTRAFVNVLPIEREPRFYLAHEDYVQCIYADLEVERRRQIHLRIGVVLGGQERAREPVRAYEIYEHLRESPSPRDSVRAGLTAARYFAAAYSIDLAVEICNHMLVLLSAPSDRDLRLELLAELGVQEIRRGRPLVAKAHLKRLLEEGERVLQPVARLEALLQLSETYGGAGEPYKGIKVLNRALKTCSAVIDARRKAQIAGRLAELRLARKDPKRAINICIQALKETEEVAHVEPERIKLLEVLAAAHLSRGESLVALQHYQTLLEVVERVRDEAKLAAVLTILGRVYYDRGNFFRAARYLFRALDAIRRQQDLRGLSRAYDSLGKVYRNSGDLLRGLEYFNRCLRLRERIGDVEGLSPTLNSLGSLYAHTGDYHRAIRYFKRSVENSERLGDTVGIVRSFLHLGRAYFEIGELRKVESLVKQILILAQEFGLPELEGEGCRLNGSLLCLRRDFKRGERELVKAIEIAKRHGKKNGEASAILDLGELLTEKEDFEGSLKQISRGQLLAEEIQSVPLQARAHLLKGNVYRFLKGGNLERAKESFRKGMDLVAGENHLPISWEIDYSIAKLFQAGNEYYEAGEAYRRAERILDRIVANLPDDMKVAFRDDSRRKTFFEDYRRFQKDASDRRNEVISEKPASTTRDEVAQRPTSHGSELETAVPAETPESRRSDRVIDALVQMGKAASLSEFAPQLLREARRLVPAPCGFLLQLSHWDSEPRARFLATSDMGAEEEWCGARKVPGSAARQAAESGQPLRSGEEAWQQLLKSVGAEQSYRNRSALVVPLAPLMDTRGALYLERPSARNPFSGEEQQWISKLLAAAGGQLAAFIALERVRHFRGTRMLSLGGLEDELPALVRRHLRGGQSFFLFEATVPGIDRLLTQSGPGWSAERATAQILETGGAGKQFVARIGSDTLVYSFDGASSGEQQQLMETLRSGLLDFVRSSKDDPGQGISVRVIQPDGSYASEDDLVQWIRSELLRRQGDFNVEREIGRLTSSGLTLKEAKTALERRYIAVELVKSHGNITRAADSLGVHRPQLSHLIKKHNVRREELE